MMGRFGRLFAILVPAVAAGGASATTTDPGATTPVVGQSAAAGSFEALTALILADPDSAQAALARDALARGDAGPMTRSPGGQEVLLSQSCVSDCIVDGFVV